MQHVPQTDLHMEQWDEAAGSSGFTSNILLQVVICELILVIF